MREYLEAEIGSLACRVSNLETGLGLSEIGPDGTYEDTIDNLRRELGRVNEILNMANITLQILGNEILEMRERMELLEGIIETDALKDVA